MQLAIDFHWGNGLISAMVGENTLSEYNRQRLAHSTAKLCHAPSVNMYFNSWGNVGACWLTLDRGPRYPEKSLHDIWFGEYFSKLRASIAALRLKDGCTVCEKRIADGVFRQVLAKAYDLPYPSTEYPQIMEFELSNLCNLACVMCKGTLSSKIRKEREGLSPLKSPYDEKFVEHLREFIPHLKEARFNGGEPFLQKICWDIWALIAELNPEISVTVATNGTMLNKKVMDVLETCRFRINVSLDSLDPATYASIRVGGDHATVLGNLGYFSDYCRRKNTNLCVMVNPMTVNWREMPAYVEWCAERRSYLWFNTIWRPRHLALWTLPSSRLKEIQEFYRQQNFHCPPGCDSHFFNMNLETFRSFAESQIDGWIKDQISREESQQDYSSAMQATLGAQDSFYKKEIFQLHRETFNWLEEKTKKVFSADVLFHHLDALPEGELEKRVRTPMNEQLLEWVYQVCDYY